MAGHPSYTSPGRPTSPSGERAGRVSPVATTFAPGDRMVPTLRAARGLLGMCAHSLTLPFPSHTHTHIHLFYLPSTAALTILMITEHRKRSIRRSGTRSLRMDTISVGTGLLRAPWPVATGRGVTFGGAPKSNGVRSFLSPAAGVRDFSFTCFLGHGYVFS
jgi:hypothetical protein